MLLEPYEMDFSQTELMEKFNLAFYEGQQNRLNKLAHEQELIDYLINNDEPSPLLTPTSDAYFDFSDFEKTFQNLPEPSLCDITETCTIFSDDELSQFLGSPRELDDLIDLEFDDSDCSLDNLTDLQDLDQSADIRPIDDYLNEDFINQQEDAEQQQQHLDEPGYYFQEERNLEMHEERNVLPPFTSITQNFENKELFVVDETSQPDFDDVIGEDLLLSSSSMVYTRRTRQFSESSESSESMVSDDCEISSSSSLELVVYQCQWDQCYQIYDSQTNLVKHIEKFHVEVKRGDEFTCFWANCPRQVKPFNARYKLLIHMRVHSGEKPNKCPFQGCNKAFSRLENLKIHQRSHTGERPYLCQFPTCTKSFSNSSDRAKHQRTHFDTKPYACQVAGCTKKYTDPSSLRKHVKNHTDEEQMLIKKKSGDDQCSFNANYVKKFLDPSKQKAQKPKFYSQHQRHNFEVEHNYSNAVLNDKTYSPSHHIKQDLKNKISEKHKLRKLFQQ